MNDIKPVPDLIEPVIGPVKTMTCYDGTNMQLLNPVVNMKDKVIKGAKEIAGFLQLGMPQLRIDPMRLSNPEIQQTMKTLRKNAPHKLTSAQRRAAKIAASKLFVTEDGKLIGYRKS
jgi:hypothetical protein